MKKKHIAEAYPFWKADQPYRAGEIIYEHLANEHRARWAAEVLELCQTKIQENEVLKSVYKIATEPKRWSSAHDKFSEVRQLLLSADMGEEPIDSLYEAVLEIAEKVCKVTYNASGEPAPFDYDSGYKLVCSLRRMVNLIGDSEFEKLAWYVVSCEKYS